MWTETDQTTDMTQKSRTPIFEIRKTTSNMFGEIMNLQVLNKFINQET